MQEIGEEVGKYRIVEKLMSTGFSDIYIADDPDLRVTVAVKIFHPKGDNVGEKAQYGIDFWRARFIEEARVLARLDHPNIVKAFFMDHTAAGQPYFVMPFQPANLLYEIGEDAKSAAEAEKIDAKWKPRAVSPRRAVEVWQQMLSALAAMHAEGLVHRDIKPQNVLLTSKRRGRVKLCDFGMVKVPGGKGSRSGIWVGTLDYISPEQRKSAAHVDARSDVYSAGVVMYRMLTGRLPADVRPKLQGERFGIPQGLATLVEACIERPIKRRPADAGEVLERLAAAVSNLGTLPDKVVAAAQAGGKRLGRLQKR